MDQSDFEVILGSNDIKRLEDSYQQQIDAQNSEIKKLQQSKQDSQEIIMAKNNEIANLQEELQRQKGEIFDLKKRQSQGCLENQKENEYICKIENYQQKLLESQDFTKQLQQELNELQQNNNQLKRKLSNDQSQSQFAINDDLNKYKQRLQDANEKILIMKETNKQLENSLSSTKISHLKLETEISDQCSELQSRMEILKLIEQHEICQETFDEVLNDFKRFHELLIRIKQQLIN